MPNGAPRSFRPWPPARLKTKCWLQGLRIADRGKKHFLNTERYNPRHIDSPLNEIPGDKLQGLEFWVDFDFTILSDPRCLRMIAKIAFEWWCFERSPEFVSSADYDEIRQYVRNGTEWVRL
jgi:hypothetical protein